MATKEPLTSKKYVDGIYIPAGLLVFGTFICKKEWLPYAIALALALSVVKFLSSRKSHMAFLNGRKNTRRRTNQADKPPAAEPKSSLKPDIFQEFELKEKTILSHNTAM